MRALLIGYMWLFIHRPFEAWPALGEFHIERIYMLVLLMYWLIGARKQFHTSAFYAATGCLTLSVLVCWVASPWADRLDAQQQVEDYLKVFIFYLIVVTTVDSEADLRILVVAYLACVFLYLGHSYREFLAGRHVYRMGIPRMVGVDLTFNDPNSLAATVNYSLPLMYPAWSVIGSDRRGRWFLGAYLLLSLACLVNTGSRTGIVGMLFAVAALVYRLRKRRYVKYLGIAALPLLWFAIPSDLQDRYLTLIDSSRGPANAQQSAEGRMIGFTDGVHIFEEHPLTGCGPGVFGKASGKGFQSHNLYGQVLGELGLIGTVSFGFLVGVFFRSTIGILRSSRDENTGPEAFLPNLAFAVLVSVLLLLLCGWGGHNLFRPQWLWFAAFMQIAWQCQLHKQQNSDPQEGNIIEDWPEQQITEAQHG
jgi:hypothetical protein